MQPPRRPEARDIGAAVSESRSWMGAGCSVDSWRLVAERGVSPAVFVNVGDHPIPFSLPPSSPPSLLRGMSSEPTPSDAASDPSFDQGTASTVGGYPSRLCLAPEPCFGNFVGVRWSHQV